MPKQVITTDANDLTKVALPNHGGSYTVISYDFIIKEVLSQLQTNGLELVKEEYCRNLNGEVASGTYYIKSDLDDELGLLLSWTNSYDKSTRFKCAIGAYSKITGAIFIAGDDTNYGKVHSGDDAEEDVKNCISSQVQNYGKYLNDLMLDKDFMKDTNLSKYEVAALMGLLYFEEGVISSSQLINIKKEHKSTNLWSIYNLIASNLKTSHPKAWMEKQKSLHLIMNGLVEEETEANCEDVSPKPEEVNILDYLVVEEPKKEDVIANYDAHLKLESQEATEFPPAPDNIPAFICEPVTEKLATELSNATMEVIEPMYVDEVINELDNVIEIDLFTKVEVEVEEDILSLEDQVAGEYVAEVSEEEIIISKPVVEEPKVQKSESNPFIF